MTPDQMERANVYLANTRSAPGQTTGTPGWGASFGPGKNGPKTPKPKQQGPSQEDQIWQGLLSLPIQAYSSFDNFGRMGGLSALLGPAMQGNPLGMMALKFAPLLFGQENQALKVPDAVPVALVEVKDTVMDKFSLSQSDIAFVEPFNRRARQAKPMPRRPGR